MTVLGFIRAATLLIAAAVLSACSTTAPVAKGTPMSTKARREISKKPAHIMYVRTTAYHHSEPGGRATAMGGYLRPTHSAASDWSWLPAGTRFRILETGESYIIEDYGSALVGKYTIDLYKSTRAAMNKWGVRYVSIEILELGNYKVSLSVLTPRQKYWHVRAMVAGLRKHIR